MKIITKTQLQALQDALCFLDAYVEYHLDDTNVCDDGQQTDAQVLSSILPVLKSVFKNDEIKKAVNRQENNTGTGYSEEYIKNLVYSERKNAAESVNPNYNYCVVDSGLTECWLTDDEAEGMEFAIGKSKHHGIWYLHEIRKVNDGTYKTFAVGFATDGDYMDVKRYRRDYLHFNYIATACHKIGKINIKGK